MKIENNPNRMELEKEIQQTRFRNQKHKALLNIVFTASWITCSQQRNFKDYGLTPQQYNVLRILRGQKGNPISVNGIQERMLDRSSNASRLIDKLLDKHLVNRIVCPNDRRQMEITVTEKGLELLAAMDDKINEAESTFGSLTEDEAMELNRLLDKMRDKI